MPHSPSLKEWIDLIGKEKLPDASKIDFDKLKHFYHRIFGANFSDKIVILIGGTNGKGSCAAFLESILLAAGHCVGTYTSPHLLKFNERIKINGHDVDDDQLCDTFSEIRKNQKRYGYHELSFFEFTTFAALYIFQRSNLDVLLLEVGLGGRLDAVNVVDPDISVITTISMDHTQILGNTLEQIGREKAGIIRKYKPIILGGDNLPASVREIAEQNCAPLYCQSKDFKFFISDVNHRDCPRWNWICSETEIKHLSLPKLPIQNASTSLMIIELLRERIKIGDESILYGIKNAMLPGRYEKINFMDRNIILDVAHNEASVKLLKENLKLSLQLGSKEAPPRVIAIFSMLKDKDIETVVETMMDIVDQWYIGEIQKEIRAASLEQLSSIFEEIGIDRSKIIKCDNMTEAFARALQDSEKNDLLVAFGSFRVVEQVMANFLR